MDKPMTLSMIANLGVMVGIDIGRWNCCDVWSWFDLEADKERINVRFHGMCNNEPLLHTVGMCRAWDMDAPSDGSEKRLELPMYIMQFSATAVRAYLVEQCLEELVAS